MRIELADEIENQIEEAANMGEPPSFALRRDQAEWLVAYLRNPDVFPLEMNLEPVTCQECGHSIRLNGRIVHGQRCSQRAA